MKKELNFAKSVIRGRITGEKIPLVAAFELTQLCNLTCDYCDVWAKQSRDLSTTQIKEIISGLAEVGTYSVSFDGGEALMRKDVGEIVDHTHSVGILPRLNSNGALFPGRVHELRNLSAVKFSLDGPKDVNDAIRGEGVFDGVMDALKAAKAHDIQAGLSAVISRSTVRRVLEMAELARALETPVSFQPAANQVDLSTGYNQHGESPGVGEFRAAIRQLLAAKKQNPYIGNSTAGLKHLLQWPKPTYIPCYAGQFTITINHKGKMYSCGRLDRTKLPVVDCTVLGVKKALEELQLAGGCGHCWCARRAESNLLFHMNPAPLLGIYRYGAPDSGRAPDPKIQASQDALKSV